MMGPSAEYPPQAPPKSNPFGDKLLTLMRGSDPAFVAKHNEAMQEVIARALKDPKVEEVILSKDNTVALRKFEKLLERPEIQKTLSECSVDPDTMTPQDLADIYFDALLEAAQNRTAPTASN